MLVCHRELHPRLVSHLRATIRVATRQTRRPRWRKPERFRDGRGVAKGWRNDGGPRAVRHVNLFEHNRSGRRSRRTLQLVREVRRCFTIKVPNDACTRGLFRHDSAADAVVAFVPFLPAHPHRHAHREHAPLIFQRVSVLSVQRQPNFHLDDPELAHARPRGLHGPAFPLRPGDGFLPPITNRPCFSPDPGSIPFPAGVRALPRSQSAPRLQRFCLFRFASPRGCPERACFLSAFHEFARRFEY